MLDTATKKRIDDCRDILVGKLPDPKAQIEQITIGLIYKFMDDMDQESIELGGKAKFFTDYKIPNPEFPNNRKKDIVVPFAKYAWHSLFDAKVTATEMFELYSAAIMSIDKNPNIPSLFRDIFKNAFLPYRDPETLKLFLKEIRGFEYTHSEKLGDAFEYLLLIMGSQGDAGQFRTPRHIIDFVVKAVNPSKTDSILDPACGTAGFLISAFKYIRGIGGGGCRDKACLVSTGETTLTPDERKKIMQNVVGYDISPDMVRLSLVNLYLHGFSDPHIYEYDTLSSEERWNDHFDVILANPPFMSPKGGIRPHKKFSISSNRSEVLFVDYIAEHLNPKGKAGIIVPEGVIFQSGTAYKALRKMLVEKYLYAVVSLPAGVFNPYSGVKTSVLLMDKELAKKKDDILFVKIDNDGFGLGAQRNEIKGGQLEEALEILQQFKQGKFSKSKMAHAVAKKEIGKNGDYNLSGERYKVIPVVSSDYKFVTFKEICEINPETVEPTTFKTDKFIYVDISSVENGTGKVKFNNLIKTSQAPSRARRMVRNNDILLSTVRPNLKAFGFVQNPPPNTVASTGFAILRAKNNFNSKFLFYNLFTDNLVNQMISMMGKGAYPSINQADVASLQIPLPSLSTQEEIVAEIEGYQKIIDGAKAVVENYKPKIDIDPDWEMVELGEVCELIMGQSPPGESYNLEGKGLPLINGPVEFGPDPFSKTKKRQYTTEPTKMCKEGDLILCVRGSTTGRMNISGFPACIGRGVVAIRSKENQGWINQYINSIREKLYSLGAGSTFPNITSATLNSLQIPLPPYQIQLQIVSQIEKEQALVNANKELIEIFEQKIKGRIAKVWGEKKKEYVMEDEALSMVAEDEDKLLM